MIRERGLGSLCLMKIPESNPILVIGKMIKAVGEVYLFPMMPRNMWENGEMGSVSRDNGKT